MFYQLRKISVIPCGMYLFFPPATTVVSCWWFGVSVLNKSDLLWGTGFRLKNKLFMYTEGIWHVLAMSLVLDYALRTGRRRLLYFLTSRLCQLMCWRFFWTPSLANLGFRARPEWRGGCEPVHAFIGPHAPESPLFDLIAQSSFNPDILGKHTQVNLCLQRQAWQQKPLRKVHCLVPRWSG